MHGRVDAGDGLLLMAWVATASFMGCWARLGKGDRMSWGIWGKRIVGL
jgi:hypothetical protein